MSPPETISAQFIDLDIHKHYFVAVGVNSRQEQIFGPQHIPMHALEGWGQEHITASDAILVPATETQSVGLSS